MQDLGKYGDLFKLLSKNHVLTRILSDASKLNLPNWYLAGGCISQTCWNVLHGFKPSSNLKDYDLVYFDRNTSKLAQDNNIMKAKRVFGGINAKIDIVNQARVHLWYPKEFGLEIPAYNSVEQGIASWPTTATCVGINLSENHLKLYATFGIKDLMTMTLRPNKQLITKQIYNSKIQRWVKIWPKLTVAPW